MRFELPSSSLLVAGASGGIGSATARALAEKGAQLTLVARQQEGLEALGIEGARLETGDITSSQDCERIVQAAVEAHGKLDGVINATGEVAFGPLDELTDDVLEELFAVNVFGPIRLVRAALPHLHEGSFVLNLSAITAELPTAQMTAYSACKGAITAFDRALAHELAPRELRVIDARPPRTVTGIEKRPLAGEAPPLPTGLDPDQVAARLVQAIEEGDREIPADAF